MPGRLVYLMGPSGSGKDTVLRGLGRLLGARAYLAPRVITRPATDTEPGAIPVSEHDFVRLERHGDLAMAWRANGLCYGIPADIDARLAAGTDVLVNGSRAYLAQARRRYRDLVPVMLTVEAGVLRQRLIARGRENENQIDSRLARNGHFDGVAHGEVTRIGVSTVGEAHGGEAANILMLDNSGRVEDTIQRLYRYLYPAQITPPASKFAGHSHATDSAGHG